MNTPLELHAPSAMTLSSLTIGDMVRLNSGGPAMTVAAENSGTIVVKWDHERAAFEMELPAHCVHRIHNLI